jgi:Tfp pilus assembly protein PilN
VRAALFALLLVPLPLGCLAVGETVHELREIERLRGELGRLAPLAAELRTQQGQLDRVRADAESWRALLVARAKWVEFLDDLQGRAATDGNLWLDRLERLPPAAQLAARTAGGVLRVCGGLHETSGASGAFPASRDRIEAFFEALKQSPWIDGLDQERFNLSADNGIRFDAFFTLPEDSLP